MPSRISSHKPKCLERLCNGATGTLAHAPAQPGLDRFEAVFYGHAYDPHRHDHYAIGFTVWGQQIFTYRKQEIRSLRLNTIVVHPDELHDGRSGDETGFCYRMIYVDPRKILNALPDGRADLPFAPVLDSSDHALLTILRSALSDLSVALSDLQETAFLAALADVLLRRSGSRQTRQPLIDRTAVKKILEMLTDAAECDVTSSEIERMTGLSRFSACRQFRRALGTTPHRYMMMRRLEKARQRLSGDERLADISAALGFADQSHLTREYKKTYGVTPAAWKRMLANVTSAAADVTRT